MIVKILSQDSRGKQTGFCELSPKSELLVSGGLKAKTENIQISL
jgi:hypothetical protein